MKTLSEIARILNVPIAELQHAVGESNEYEVRLAKATTIKECFAVYNELYNREAFKEIRPKAIFLAIEKAETFKECIECYQKTVYKEAKKSAIHKALHLAETAGECWAVHHELNKQTKDDQQVDEKELFVKIGALIRKELKKRLTLTQCLEIHQTELSTSIPDYKEIQKDLVDRMNALAQSQSQRTRSFEKILELLAMVRENRGFSHFCEPFSSETFALVIKRGCILAKKVSEYLTLLSYVNQEMKRGNEFKPLCERLMERVLKKTLRVAKGRYDYSWILLTFSERTLGEKIEAYRTKIQAEVEKHYRLKLETLTYTGSCLDALESVDRENAHFTELRKDLWGKALRLAQSFGEFRELRLHLKLLPDTEREKYIRKVDASVLQSAQTYEECLVFLRDMREWGRRFPHYKEIEREVRQKGLTLLKSFNVCLSEFSMNPQLDLLERGLELAETSEECGELLSFVSKENVAFHERVLKKILELEGQLRFKK